MRTFLFLVGGVVLWAVFMLLARYVFVASNTATATATQLFIVVWLGVAALNMWVGISQAGYSFREELPIFLLIFLFPAAVAALAKWRFL